VDCGNSRTAAARGSAIPASAAPVAADSQPPTAPQLLHIAGLGGCEIDLRLRGPDEPPTARSCVRNRGLTWRNGRFVAKD
jgi:hypothetical protein